MQRATKTVAPSSMFSKQISALAADIGDEGSNSDDELSDNFINVNEHLQSSYCISSSDEEILPQCYRFVQVSVF